MANERESIELRLVARADMADVPKANQALQSVDANAKKATDSLKKLEDLAGRTVRAMNPNSTLAAPPTAAMFKDAAQLRREEREAGLRTERTMAAEERQRQTDARRRQQFLEDAQRQRSQSSDSGSDEGASLFDLAKNLRAKSAALLAAIGSAAAVAAKGLREYSKEQQASAAVDASLATRGVLVDQYRQKVLALSQALQDKTGIRRGDFEKAFGQMIENGGDVTKLDELGRVLENIAGLMRGDVSRASLALSNALEGNFTSLHRIGIIVPENASLLEKWNSVVRQSERGAGQLAAQNQTLAGQFRSVSNAANDVFGVLGKGLAQVTGLSMWLNIAGGSLAALARHMGGVTPPALQMNNALSTSSQRLAHVRESAAEAAREFNSIHAASERASQAMERQARAAEAIHRAQDNIASAGLDLRLAQIDAAEHGGRISPQQASIARANVRLTFEQGRFSRDQQANADQIHAAEARLNQMGAQRGMAESEQSAAQREFDRQTEAHAARAAAANAQQTVEALRRRLADEESASALEGSADIDSPGEIARRAVRNRASSQTRAEIAAAEARAVEAQHHAESFGPALNDSNLTAATERLAKAAEQLQQIIVEERQNAPGLQDAAGNARLNLNSNAAVFEMVRQMMGVQLNDTLSNSRVTGNTPQLRAQIQGHEQENLINQLRSALQLRSDLMMSGFTDMIQGINADIRNIQAQIRTLSSRR